MTDACTRSQIAESVTGVHAEGDTKLVVWSKHSLHVISVVIYAGLITGTRDGRHTIFNSSKI